MDALSFVQHVSRALNIVCQPMAENLMPFEWNSQSGFKILQSPQERKRQTAPV
jgi:hypothetical protein